MKKAIREDSFRRKVRIIRYINNTSCSQSFAAKKFNLSGGRISVICRQVHSQLFYFLWKRKDKRMDYFNADGNIRNGVDILDYVEDYIKSWSKT